MNYDGSKELLTLDRLREEYKTIPDDYLTRLLRHLLEHCKDNGDARNRRIRSLKDGDENLLTMLTAFEGQAELEEEAATYGTLYELNLGSVQLHQFMQARSHGFRVRNRDWRMPFYNALYKEQVNLFGHRAGVYCLIFDKNNLRLLTGSDDSLVKVWDARYGYLIHTIRGHFNVINDIAINEENSLIATASSDGYVRVWKMENFQPVAALKSPTTLKAFTTIKFSPSPDPQTRYLLATNEDGQVRLWKWDKESLQFPDIANPIAYSCKFKGSDRLRCSTWNSTGTRFAVAGDDGFVYIFSIKAPAEPLKITESVDENDVIDSGTEDNADAKRPTEENAGPSDTPKETAATDATDANVNGSTASQTTTVDNAGTEPNQATSASDNASNEASQTPAADAAPVEQKPRGGGRRRVPNALFPNRNTQIPEQPVIPIAHLEGHLGSITDLAYNHRGDKLLSGSLDGTARIWWYDTKSKRWESIVLDITEEKRGVPRITPEKENITFVDQDKVQEDVAKMREDSIEKPSPRKRIPGRPRFQKANIEQTGGRLMQPMPPSPPVNDENSPIDVSVPSSALPANTDEIREQGTAALNEADEVPVKVSMICWSADDRKCFVATNKGDIAVFSETSGHPLCILSGHNAEVYAVDSNPVDPDTLVSAGYDGRVIVWNLAIQKAHQCYSYPERVFLDCKYASDGASFAVVDEGGTCTLYSIASEDQYKQTRQWKRGQFFISDYQALKLLNDDTILDDITQQPPHLQAYTPIIDMQGVEYPNQKKKGYGRDIPIDVRKTYISEALVQNYIKEVEQLRISEPVPAPGVNRGLYLQRRKEFVKNDEEEAEIVYEEPIAAPPSPQIPFLLPDNPLDEDYHDESSDEESTDTINEAEVPEILSAGEDHTHIAEEEGPITRSRSGRVLRPPRAIQERVSTTRTSTRPQRRREGRQTGGRTTRASAALAAAAITASFSPPLSGEQADINDAISPLSPERHTGTRRRRSSADEEDEAEWRPTTRRRLQISYHESDPEESPEEIQVVESSSEESYHPEVEAPTSPPVTGRRGKRKLRSNALDSGSEEEEQVNAEPSSSRATKRRTLDKHKAPQAESSSSRNVHAVTGRRGNTRGGQKGQMRALSQEEIRLHEPTEWISCTERTLAKYHPQVGDRIALLTEGHQQYWNTTQYKDHFDAAHGPFEHQTAVVFGTIRSISWHVGPPAFCQIKLHTTELVNLHDALFNDANPVWSTRGRDVVIDYCDEDGYPEFMILWERFLASMQYMDGLQVGDRVDAMYGDDKYTGTVQAVRESGWAWPRSEHRNPWQLFHIVWDQESQAEDLSPWEIVPSNQDFYETYDVGKRLSDTEKRRALDIIAWLESNPEFQLYVPPVDYYRYSSYLSQVAYPIHLQMVTARIENDFYRQKEAVIDDVELIRKNAQRFNNASSAASKNALRMSSFFKSRMTNMRMPIELRGGRRRAKEESEYEDDGEVSDEPSSPDEAAQEDDDDDYED